jgi:galactokinase
MERLDRLRTCVLDAFRLHFPGPEPRCFQAPGRVNLIGEHTDYNDGFVLPMAIDRQVLVAARRRTDGLVQLWSVDFGEGSTFALDGFGQDPRSPWSNYVRGVVEVLQRQAVQLTGMDLAIAGDVPIGAGLSSSAALEVVTAVTLRALNGLPHDNVHLALACQRAENEFVGMSCGIMDQLIAIMAKPGQALCIDCRSLETTTVPLPPGTAVVVCDTMKRRELVASEYNERRRECELGVSLLRQQLPGIRALRDVTSRDLRDFGHLLPSKVRQRCAHVVSENERVLSAVAALRAGDAEGFGALMNQSHHSLRYDYEVSCRELDVMVQLSREDEACVGARMTGAGFGGCAVSLTKGNTERFGASLARAYEAETGLHPAVFACQAAGGAGELRS